MLKHRSKEAEIRRLVRASVEAYAVGFEARHVGELDNPDGVINMKIHNVFIAALGPEIQYYTALVRSLDSSLGSMLEKLAFQIADLSFTVEKAVEGPLRSDQTSGIAALLERYKRRDKIPEISDYQFLRNHGAYGTTQNVRHESDYFLTNMTTGERVLIELKIGGDLDNKKARSEKEAILEQYAILSNTLNDTTPISIYFATAYNRYGEGRPWLQQRVRQFFAEDELLIGCDFWNFVCQSPSGYSWVIDEYNQRARAISDALARIRQSYLG